MRIHSFSITDLLGRPGTIEGSLNDDINIVTGRNGAGKTTLIKLMWYIISGNIGLAIREIEFSQAHIVTSDFTCTVNRYNRVTCDVTIDHDGESTLYEDIRDDDGDVQLNAEDIADPEIRTLGTSVCFPTFRRIEGGVSLSKDRGTSFSFSNALARPPKNEIEDALSSLSRRLSWGKNVFVSSISTVDVVSLLMRQYTDLSELSNDLQKTTSQSVIDSIKTYRSGTNTDDADYTIDSIRMMIEEMELQRDAIMSPIAAVKSVVEQLFRHTGINISARLSFGDAANSVNSDSLSAGEKQMLSFICYNAFYDNATIFIDEPELSLHVDWQRQLFPILMSQGTSNQFIIATHSPFIYSKYPDKEVALDTQRGDEEYIG